MEDGAEPEPIEIAPGVEITKAFVKWNISSANKPEIFVYTDGPILKDSFEPVTGDPDDSYWLAENEAGLFRGWQTSLPVSEETGMANSTIKHAELGTVEDRYEMLDHVVKSKQNDREDKSCFSVRFKTPVHDGRTGSIPIRKELGEEIIKKYINGPLGHDQVAFAVWKRDKAGTMSSWNRFINDRSDYEGYMDCEVTMAFDSIYTWYPARVQDMEE